MSLFKELTAVDRRTTLTANVKFKDGIDKKLNFRDGND